MVTNQGINHMLDVTLHGAAQITTWYIVPFTGNYTPTVADDAASFHGAAGEATTQYAEGSRPTFVEGAASGQVIGNTASEGVITATGAVTIYGFGLSSSPLKGSASGILLAAARFPTPKTLETGEQLKLTAELTGVNV